MRSRGGWRLCGADIGGGLVASDVLLASLHRHAVSGLARGIDAHPYDPPRHLARQVTRGGEEAGVRPSKAEGHPQPLGGADADVGSPQCGRLQRGEREEVGGSCHLAARRRGLGGEVGVVEHRPICRLFAQEGGSLGNRRGGRERLLLKEGEKGLGAEKGQEGETIFGMERGGDGDVEGETFVIDTGGGREGRDRGRKEKGEDGLLYIGGQLRWRVNLAS